jgi:hypothetical protein
VQLPANKQRQPVYVVTAAPKSLNLHQASSAAAAAYWQRQQRIPTGRNASTTSATPGETDRKRSMGPRTWKVSASQHYI